MYHSSPNVWLFLLLFFSGFINVLRDCIILYLSRQIDKQLKRNVAPVSVDLRVNRINAL